MAGLNLYQETSGKTELDESKIVRHITKRGRPRLRTALFFVALRNCKKSSPFRAYYDRLNERGKAAKVILIAMCRKFLRMMFAMVRDDSMFMDHHLSV